MKQQKASEKAVQKLEQKLGTLKDEIKDIKGDLVQLLKENWFSNLPGAADLVALCEWNQARAREFSDDRKELLEALKDARDAMVAGKLDQAKTIIVGALSDYKEIHDSE